MRFPLQPQSLDGEATTWIAPRTHTQPRASGGGFSPPQPLPRSPSRSLRQAPSAEADACAYGYSASSSVFFGAGSASSGVANYDTGDGCTVMDEVMAGAPFASHGKFLSTVNGVTNELRRDGVLTSAEKSDIVAAAAPPRSASPTP